MNCSILTPSYPRHCGHLENITNLDNLVESLGNSGNLTLCTIQPDPDIAGIGVVLSFISIGFLVILLAFPQIFRNEYEKFHWDQLFRPMGWIEQFPLRGPNGQRTNKPNLADAKRFLERMRQEKHGTSALSATIFNLADTQFVTGIAIAAAMSKKDIVVAHFSLATELGWLGYISGTVGLLTTRSDVLDRGNNAKRLVRVCVMWAHLGLLIHRLREVDDSLWFAQKVSENGPPTATFRWDFSDPGSRASVFLFVWSIGGAIVDTIFLFPGYAILAYYYFGKALSYARSASRRSFSIVLRVCWSFVYLILLGLYWMFLEPVFCNVGNLGFFLWGVVAAFQYRNIGHSCMTDDDKPKENEVGFGQIVALVLLIAPAINTADLWWGVLSTFPCLM
ncbi:hypothetical protein FDECE_6714 [Fusarium decemcellulare]|nr:hypothetical protein FDECE_6714 [Fusarium decemcellulare]